ncbi:MAG: hypothetical protein J7499_09475 [Sphingopyxis sp.]|nr:hypothetical protein [Sphingopyxis sp.]
MRPLLSLAALALLTAPLPALACSVVAGYRVPTNLELVERSELILLGTVTPGASASDSLAEQTIAIEPVEALKGAMPAGPVILPAMLDTGGEVELSNPYELREPHPQTLAGACVRYVFPRGSRVLFFLDREDGQWREAGGPFSRSAEDVLTDDAPWLQTVRFYIEVAKLPEADRAAALAARRDELGALGDDPVAQLIAADIDRQLGGPNAPMGEPLPPVPGHPQEWDRPSGGGDAPADEAGEAADEAAGDPDAPRADR